MTPFPGPGCRTASLALWGVLALAGPGLAPVGAGTERRLPEGVRIGPWVVSPWFESGYEWQDNLFRASDAEGPESDRIQNLKLGVLARMPLRMSFLDLGYGGEYQDYAENDFDRKLQHRVHGSANVVFSSGDRLALRESYVSAFSDVVIVDAGGEYQFQGEPYESNRVELELGRDVPRHAGYLVRLVRVDFNFTDDEPVAYFDYRGWEAAGEYRKPISSKSWLLAGVAGRTYDHFHHGVPQEVGIPFEDERGITLEGGLRGMIGPAGAYSIRAGYTTYRIRGLEPGNEYANDFTGVSALGDLRWPLGSRTALQVGLSRRPLPSTLNTYYINTSLRVAVERTWLRDSRLGVEVSHAQNHYGDVPGAPEDVPMRDDRFYGAGAYLAWRLHPRIDLRFAAYHQSRSSNLPEEDYRANQVTMGLRLGWFE